MKFNEAQTEALSHRDGPMMVLAGPGSGKTTVITHRIFRLLEAGVSPSGILVITFTKAAAMEMRKRFFALMDQAGMGREQSQRVSFGTFHSIFYQILRLAYRFPPGNVIGEEEKREYLKSLISGSELEVEDEGDFLSSLVNEISYVKGEQIDLSCYYSQNCPEEWFKKLYTGYDRMLREKGKIDFDDMLLMCWELFRERKDILAAWQRKYRYILVDEFQDINRLQYEVIRMLALPENNLFIVGDDDQSIYRFRGAKPEIMLGFERDYPGCGRILLGTNYRSTKEIVDASLRLISHNQVRFKKELVPARGMGRPVKAVLFENPQREMDAVARALRSYREAGFDWKEMAVLFRTGANSGLLAEKLMEYNIPFQMRDAIPNLYRHWIARDFFAYLSIGAGSRKRADFLRIMNRPNRYFSRAALEHAEVSFDSLLDFYEEKDWMKERIYDLEADLRTIGRLKPGPALHYIRKSVGYDEYLKEYAVFRRLDPEELFEVADKLTESAGSFETFALWMEHVKAYEEELRRQSQSDQKKKDGVMLSTMHSAKGLEYRVVFVVDVNEGIIPHHKAAQPADLEEERRLFYVALTRARDRLHLCAVRERYHRKQEPSRFLKECLEAEEKREEKQRRCDGKQDDRE